MRTDGDNYSSFGGVEGSAAGTPHAMKVVHLYYSDVNRVSLLGALRAQQFPLFLRHLRLLLVVWGEANSGNMEWRFVECCTFFKQFTVGVLSFKAGLATLTGRAPCFVLLLFSVVLFFS